MSAIDSLKRRVKTGQLVTEDYILIDAIRSVFELSDRLEQHIASDARKAWEKGYGEIAEQQPDEREERIEQWIEDYIYTIKNILSPDKPDNHPYVDDVRRVLRKACKELTGIKS